MGRPDGTYACRRQSSIRRSSFGAPEAAIRIDGTEAGGFYASETYTVSPQFSTDAQLNSDGSGWAICNKPTAGPPVDACGSRQRPQMYTRCRDAAPE
jgi:hypothetical protein